MNRSVNNKLTSLVGALIVVVAGLWATRSVYQYETAKRDLMTEQAKSLTTSPSAVIRTSSGSNLPTPMTLSQGKLLTIIQNNVKLNGVSLKSITFSQGSPTTPAVAILVSGSFSQLESFLKDMETVASSMQITSVNVATDPSGKSENQMSLQVSTPLQG